MQKNLSANSGAASTMEFDIPREANGAVGIQTDAGINAGAVFILDVSVPGDKWVLGVQIFDPVARAWGANLTGPDKFGYAEVPGATKGRIRRTDANGGAAVVFVEARAG